MIEAVPLPRNERRCPLWVISARAIQAQDGSFVRYAPDSDGRRGNAAEGREVPEGDVAH
jgi:hypothetical protein